MLEPVARPVHHITTPTATNRNPTYMLYAPCVRSGRLSTARRSILAVLAYATPEMALRGGRLSALSLFK